MSSPTESSSNGPHRSAAAVLTSFPSKIVGKVKASLSNIGPAHTPATNSIQDSRRKATELRTHPSGDQEVPVFDIRPAHTSRSSDMQSAVIPDALSSSQSWRTTAYATTSEATSLETGSPTQGYTNVPHTWPVPSLAERTVTPRLTMLSNEHPSGLDVLATLDDMLARREEQQKVESDMHGREQWQRRRRLVSKFETIAQALMVKPGRGREEPSNDSSP